MLIAGTLYLVKRLSSPSPQRQIASRRSPGTGLDVLGAVRVPSMADDLDLLEAEPWSGLDLLGATRG